MAQIPTNPDEFSSRLIYALTPSPNNSANARIWAWRVHVGLLNAYPNRTDPARRSASMSLISGESKLLRAEGKGVCPGVFHSPGWNDIRLPTPELKARLLRFFYRALQNTAKRNNRPGTPFEMVLNINGLPCPPEDNGEAEHESQKKVVYWKRDVLWSLGLTLCQLPQQGWVVAPIASRKAARERLGQLPDDHHLHHIHNHFGRSPDLLTVPEQEQMEQMVDLRTPQ